MNVKIRSIEYASTDSGRNRCFVTVEIPEREQWNYVAGEILNIGPQGGVGSFSLAELTSELNRRAKTLEG